MECADVDILGEKLAHAVDGMMVGDAFEHIAEISFGVEAIKLGGLDQAKMVNLQTRMDHPICIALGKFLVKSRIAFPVCNPWMVVVTQCRV